MDATTKDFVIQYLIEYSRQLEREAEDQQHSDGEKSLRLQAKAQQIMESALSVSRWHYCKAMQHPLDKGDSMVATLH